jgi:arsenite methyltransferase
MTTEPMTTDLLFQDRIRDLVRRAYGAIPHGAGRAVAARFYPDDQLTQVPDQAIDWALGVGNPVVRAGLRSGETVLDVGCGGGLDTILAAQAVGETGHVIGLDLLPEMCERAEVAARLAGTAAWCEFRAGEMEAIPLPDASVDVVISNGAINLSPRKGRTLAEIARVLRPGGRLCVADLIVDDELPPEVLGHEASWAGCIAGALSERVFRGKLARAGFSDVEVDGRTPFGLDDVARYPLFDPPVLELLRRAIPPERQDRVAVGVTVRATATDPPTSTVAPAGATTGARPLVRRLDDVPPESAAEAPGVTIRRLKRVEDVDLKTLDIAPGGSTPFHTHPHSHEGLIVDGEGGLRLQDRTEPLRTGDVFSVEPQRPHAIENHGEGTLRLLCLDCLLD